MSFRRYPAYRNSGVEWLGEVPEHWETWKLTHAFPMIGSGTTPKSDNQEFYDGGEIHWVNTGDLNDGELNDCEKRITALAISQHTSLRIYPAGSLLIAMYGATIGRLAIINFSATVNQACCVFAASSVVSSRFMFYLFVGMRQHILSLATGGGQPNISQDILRNLRASCPSAFEQNCIAAFLDRETAKIDGLVAEQQRLIDLLKEKRQAVISHAVTKGLNPAAPMKPSGIEWLGDVPTHWEVKPLKYSISKISQGWSPQCESEPALENEWGVLKVGCGNGDKFNPMEQKTLPLDVEPITEYEIKAGDILVSRGNSLELVGMATFVEQVRPRLLLCDLLYRFHAKSDRADSEFLVLSLRSPNVRFQIERDATGTSASMKKIGQGVIREFLIAIPPLTEQRAITGFVKTETARLDALTAEAQRAIGLLQERRTALISAAVTGQIDVRHLTEAPVATISKTETVGAVNLP